MLLQGLLECVTAVPAAGSVAWALGMTASLGIWVLDAGASTCSEEGWQRTLVAARLLQELQTPWAGGSRGVGLCTGDGAREGPQRGRGAVRSSRWELGLRRQMK